MYLKLPKSHFETVDLNISTGLTFLAGPNAVGKTHLLKQAFDISTQLPGRPTGVTHISRPKISVDDTILTPLLITAEELRDVSVALQADLTFSRGSTLYSQIEDAIRQEQSGAQVIGSILDSLTNEEKGTFITGTGQDKVNVARNVEVRLSQPSLKRLGEAFFRYHRAYNRLALQEKSDNEIIEALGEAPWRMVSKAFEALGLPYWFDTPDLRRSWHEDATYLLRNKRTGLPVTGNNFSSGERVLLALCELILSDTRPGKRLFMFDDVDGLLHPPALKRFISFVRQELVANQGHFAIWTTHSPVSVQLAGNANYFYLKEYGRLPAAITRTELIDRLSGGELVVLENTVMVFVEGQDHGFYNNIFRRLEIDGEINVTRSVRFISPNTDPHGAGAGHSAVTEAIASLVQNGFSRLLAGLVDGDDRRSSLPAGVERLPRYSVENYWMDPLNIHSWFLDNDIERIPEVLRFPEVSLGMGSKFVSVLRPDQLQKIVDYWANAILARWQEVVEAHSFAQSVSTTEQRQVQFRHFGPLNYPAILLDGPGKEIINRIVVRLNTRLNRTNLEKHFYRAAIWPLDLINLMQQFATAPAGQD